MGNNIRFYADIMQPPSEVTGSFNLVIVKIYDKTIKFIVDCGMYQEREYEQQNVAFPVKPETLDFAVLTHNHVDHNGRFPFLVKSGFSGPIFTTVPTSMLLGRALGDNLKVMSDTSKRSNSSQLYCEDDVDKTLKQMVPCKYLEPIVVNEHVILHFLYNGHLTGAASVLVQIKCQGCKDIWILFSGDYNNKNMFFPVPPIREWIRDIPHLTVVCESTYGLMNSWDIEYVFEENILNAIRAEKTVIIPAFSLGRSQEVLWTLKDMKERYRQEFRGLPIYFDGKLAFYYTDMYRHLYEERTDDGKRVVEFYEDKIDFIPPDLIRVSDKGIRRDIVADSKSKIIVTTSGMGSYGPAQTYIPAYIKRSDALIHFTGYCAEGTLGYRLKEAEIGEVVEVGGLQVEKAGNVEFTKEFTAHAKADELIQFLQQFRNLDTVLVNHGSSEAKKAFAKRVVKEVRPNQVGILGEEYFFRVNSDGFDKQMGSKFK